MKYIKIMIIGASLMLSMVSCTGSKTENGTTDESTLSEREPTVSEPEVAAADIEFLKDFYTNVVFAWGQPGMSDADMKKAQEKLLNSISPEVEKFIKSEYGYYKVSEFRTDYEDGPEDESSIVNIENDEKNWYLVTYSDMGIMGETRIHILEGKIVDVIRVSEENLSDEPNINPFFINNGE